MQNQSTFTSTEDDILMTSPFALQGAFGKQLTAANTTGLLSNILQGDNCDDWTNNMDCDEEDDNHHISSSHRLIRGGSGMVSHDSTGSLDSTCSSSSTPEEYEPELSQSFGSTKSYDLMTPIKPHIPLHGIALDGRNSLPNSPLALTLPISSPSLASSLDIRSISELKAHHLSQQRHSLGEKLGLKIETQTKSPKTGTLRANRIKAPGLAGRLKINLPASSAFGAALAPQTPGGHIATGARDGAANGGPPLSPFEPPTPLCATAGEANLFSSAMTNASRPKLQHRHTATSLRHNSANVAGMSPITKQFAAVSMRKASSSKGESSPETLSSLLTPPFSPLTMTKSLPGDLDLPTTPLERHASASSSTSNASISTKTKRVDNVRSAVSVRPKQVKNKVSPYPLFREEVSVKSSSTLESSPSALFSPTPSILKDIVKPPMAAPLMEKCISEPVHKTVSAKHLAHRTLHPVFSANYTLGDELGSGGFGFVVKATRNVDGMPVAVKFIWKEKVPSHGWVRDDEFGAIPMEAFVLKVVDSPFVVKFVDLFDDDQFFYLVMEHHGTPWKAPGTEGDDVKVSKQMPQSTAMKSSKSQPHATPITSPTVVFAPESDIPLLSDNSSSMPIKANTLPPPPRPAAMERKSSCDLFECIEQHSRLSEDKARWVFAQIVEAVYYLDKRGICHRDIKDENCVIDSEFNVKLIDFGSSVITDPRRPTPYFNRFFGTMTFASSEILQGKQYRAPHAEIWSLGVLLSILLSGECPFADPTAAIRGKISRPSGTWSSDALNLLMACLVVNPDKRATIAQIRQHPWVTKAWLQHGRSRPGDDDLFAFARSA